MLRFDVKYGIDEKRFFYIKERTLGWLRYDPSPTLVVYIITLRYVITSTGSVDLGCRGYMVHY